MNTKKVYQKLREENEEARKIIYDLLLHCNAFRALTTFGCKTLNENIEKAKTFLKKESIYE